MTPRILELLSKLISFKSVTPKGKDALIFITNLLEPLGFECIIKDFGPNNEVSNLYAVRGQNKPNICFAGHVDVVPPLNEESWKFDPYTLTTEGETIYGRGVVDMKGAIACALTAVENFIQMEKEHKGSISFLLTTDEEGEGTYGLKKMLEYITDQGHKMDFCILGEPTSEKNIGDIVKIGRRGSINFDLAVNGMQGHVAYPDKAKNPSPAFSKILQQLTELKLDDGTEYFQPSNIEVTSIQMGENVSNVIPQSAHMKFNIRFNDLHSKEELYNIVTKIAQEHSHDFSLSYTCSSLPFCQKISTQMQDALRIISQSCDIEAKFDTNGGTSDARFIHKYTQIIEIGLKSEEAHKINESCQISDLQKICDVYSHLLVEFLT